jgi:hypothetical protein
MQITRSTFLVLTNTSEPRLNGVVREGFLDAMKIGVSSVYQEAVDGIREVEKYVKRDYSAVDAVAFRMFSAMTESGMSGKAASRLIGVGRGAIDDGAAKAARLGLTQAEVFAVWVNYANDSLSVHSGDMSAIAEALRFDETAVRRRGEEEGNYTSFIQRFRAESISLQVFEVQRVAKSHGWDLGW